MSESYAEMRDRLTAKYGAPTFTLGDIKVPTTEEAAAKLGKTLPPLKFKENVEPVEKDTAFVISPPGSEKMYLTGRVKAESWDTPVNRAFTYVTGRYVQAETANQNGAFWTADDLSFGHPTVAFGPVNLLHDEQAIIGAISEAHLNENDGTYGTHITTCNVLWKYLFPQAVQAVEKAGAAGELWQSMECVAEKVQCMGCDEEFDYGTWMRDKSSGCEHLTNGGTRRLVRPTFLATGIILGASRPAWSDADIEVRKTSAKLAEMNHLYEGNMTREDAENIVAQVLNWSKTH